MKRRLLAVLMAAAMTTGLTACGGGGGTAETTAAGAAETTEAAAETTTAAAQETKTASEPSDGGFELALVTDLGTIDDKSFNQGAWEGLTKYAEENNISYKYYQPQEGTTDSYLETIGLAVEGGAKLVVRDTCLRSRYIWHRISLRTPILFFWTASPTAATTPNTEPMTT